MKLLWLFIGIGSFIGGLIPELFGGNAFSLWGIIGSMLGAFVGIYAYHYFDL
jgi:uncharacterized membrane protein YeaQ/YmgE (transglycosylase-associated protein family)